MISSIKKRMGPLVKRSLGSLDPKQRSIRGSLSVFLYHEVSDDPSPFMNAPNLNVPPALFSRQMDFIRDHFNLIDPDQLLAGNYDQPAALITFDDGMLGYFKNAVPIMTEKKIPSINFLNMETIEDGLSWTGLVSHLITYDVNFQNKVSQCYNQSPPYNITLIEPDFVNKYISTVDMGVLDKKVRDYTGPIATMEDIDAVNNNPYVFLGNHLYNHYSAISLDEPHFKEQFSLNQEKIDQIPNGRSFFAYPFGRFGHHQTDLLKSYGADVVFFLKRRHKQSAC